MRRNGWRRAGIGLAAVLAVCVGGATAWGAHHEGKGDHRHGKKHHGKHFEKRDANGDGAISKDEWMAAADARFAKMDADGDGSISQDEWKGAHEAMRKRMKDHHGGGH